MLPDHRTTGPWRGIVAGFDGSDRARCAVRWAAGEATARGCPLHLVHVVAHRTTVAASGWFPVLTGPDEHERDLLEDQLVAEVDACRAEHPGLEVHAAMHDGSPYACLVEHADLVDADVFAVGASDLGAVTRLVLGSTGTELIRTTKRLVVVVRDQTPVQQAAVATGYAPVVALLDDRDTTPRVLAFAFDIAARWGADVTVLHQAPENGTAVGMDRRVPAAVLRGRLDLVRRQYPGVTARVDTVVTGMAQAVLEHSAEARLVVVGSREHGVVHRLLSGSPGHKVVHHAQCSVAVVP